MGGDMSANARRVDIAELKSAAIGRVIDILINFGYDPAILDGHEHPCPKCGGNTRARLMDREAGAFRCSHCFAEKCGDFIAAVAWLNNWTLSDTINRIADYIWPTNSTNDVTGILDPLDTIVAKKGIPNRKSLISFGAKTLEPGRVAISIPMYGPDGKKCSSNTIWAKGNAKTEEERAKQEKGKNDYNKQVGIYLPHTPDGEPRKPQPGEKWIGAEGPKDAAAILAIFPEANVFGMPSKYFPKTHAPMLSGVDVSLVVQGDAEARKASLKNVETLNGVANSVTIAQLDDGDVRDILRRPGGRELISQTIANGIPAGDAKTVESVRVIPSAEFFTTNYQREYIVERILSGGQPCIMGGKSKTLKTTLATDLALSIGSGSKFLGEFQTIKKRVAMLSGESGDYTLQESAIRIAYSRGINGSGAEVFWGFDLPCLGSPEGLAATELMLAENQIQVLIVDPAYLSLMGQATKGLNAANLFDIGPLLLQLAAMCKANSTTLILVHHCRKNSPEDKYSKPTLEELSMAGFGEFARQWILLGRREAYQSDGEHRLWMEVGGSAGHCGSWAVDVSEGVPDGVVARGYEVTIKTARDETEDRKQRTEKNKAAEQEDRNKKARHDLVEVIRQFPNGETGRTIEDEAGINHAKFKTLIKQLKSQHLIQKCEVTKNNKKYDGWKLAATTATSATSATNDIFSQSRSGSETVGEVTATRVPIRGTQSQSHSSVPDGEVAAEQRDKKELSQSNEECPPQSPMQGASSGEYDDQDLIREYDEAAA
jgi:hypothetical protein